jgi:amino acid adenylation domain-containing protein
MRIRELTPAQRALLVRRLKDSATRDSVQPRVSIPISSRAGGPLPVSFEQQRLWVLDHFEPNSSLYTIAGGFYLMGPLSVTALEQSLNHIVKRHEILRTTIDTVDDQPVQVIAAHVKIKLAREDLTNVPAAERDAALQKLSRERLREPFDLRRGPLLRCVLVGLAEQVHVLHVTMHHIIADDWSLKLFANEMNLLYQGYSNGSAPTLPPLTVQYADYAVWQRQSLQGPKLAQQLAYWEKQMQGAPAALELAPGHRRPPILTHEGEAATFALPPEKVKTIRELSYKHGATLFMTLLAGFCIVLYRRTGETDIVIGTPVSNRNRPETGALIGFFGNTLPLRIHLAENANVHETLNQVRDVTLGAYANHDVPLEQIIELAQPQRSRSHTPLFQVAFTMQHASKSPLKLEGVDARYLEVATETAKFELALTMTEIADGQLVGSLEYNRNLFQRGTIQRIIDQLTLVLEGMAANPECRISSLPLLAQREHALIIHEWNNTESEYPRESCVHELFEEQARKTPQAPAVEYEDQKISYAELNRRANQAAHYLKELGLCAEDRVGLCMERGVEMVVWMLGTLKAGGTYVPLEREYPRERLEYMVKDTGAKWVVVGGGKQGWWQEWIDGVVDVEGVKPELARQPGSDLRVKTDPRNLAYIMYTSGSTGRPKGVSVVHQGIIRLVKNTNYVQIREGEGVAQTANIAFDASTFEVWGALLNGGHLVGISREELLNARELRKKIESKRIGVMFLTTSLFNQMARGESGTFTGLRVLLAGGEAIDAGCVRKALSEHGVKEVVNGYGPTETTTFASCHGVKEIEETATTVPIGRGISNTRLYVLDGEMRPVGIEINGELYIGGAGLARGYWRRPELTAEKFVPDPLGRAGGERLYRTGDLVRWREDGNLEFIGRRDGQIKIRGFRIELGEIEAVLAAHPDVREAAVVAQENQQGDKRLAAYVVPRQAQPVELGPLEAEQRSCEEILNYMKERLPEYMVPASCTRITQLPLNPNGKLDRKALATPEKNVFSRSYEAPRGELEEKLAKIWADMLKIERVGRHDNFFDLGGHSILAVEATSRANRAGLRLNPVQLLQEQTIAGLAARIAGCDEQAAAQPQAPIQHAPPLIALQPQGARQPFFCVHPGPGSPLCYMELSRSLGQDQPFYGLQARGLADQEEPLTSIEEMSALYIEAIQQLKPAGPYILGGHSLGSHIAFEMALQLRRKGFEVSLLVVLDSAPPVFGKHKEEQENTINETKLLAAAVKTVERFTNQNLSLTEESLAAMTREDQFKEIMERLRAIHFVASDTDLSYVNGLLRVARAGFLALQRYQPATWDAPPIALFRASDLNLEDYPRQYLHYFQHPTYTWDQIFPGQVESVVVPGDHITMLRQPNVDVLAERLKCCLDRHQRYMVKAF